MDPSPADALERRKQVRLRLRPELVFASHRYEGRSHAVVKDPVALRYYFFNEHEHFLLRLMDGRRTLEAIQQEFERHFRPERLPLEDLEAFARQLLETGLVVNESPLAGRLLWTRAKRRRRRAFWAAIVNILSVRIPLFDPDRLLTRLVRPLGFLFTRTFLLAGVGVMLVALGLVLGRWETFVARLPGLEELFSIETLLSLWLALGFVKVLHEFGHGLCCKRLGGEVHEMGLLFLMFSPCLYCNVTDASMFPSKWRRIAVGSAGIYIELLLASLATFGWWASDPGTFLSQACLSLMIVCSVNTFLFNANPLLRFDGYYVLADWVEIPNLQERSGAYVENLALHYGLGIEVPPEPPMTRTRQVFFITYAIASYVYRWVLTFTILYVLDTFLKPHKLAALSRLLAVAAVATMIGGPLYRVGRAIYLRGRLPDMKPRRVAVTVAIIAGLLVLIFLVPFPVKVKGTALVLVEPESAHRVIVPESGAFLEELLVRDGQSVCAGDALAVLSNLELEVRFRVNEAERMARRDQRRLLIAELAEPAAAERTGGDWHELAAGQRALREQQTLMTKQRQQLFVRAPRDGVVLGLRRPEERGKWLEPGTELCRVGDRRALRVVLVVPPEDQSLIAPGQQAWVRIHGRRYNYWSATVSDVSLVDASAIPRQLAQQSGGDVIAQPDPQTGVAKPQTPHYLVAVRLLEQDEAINPGALGRVKITTQPQTLWWRCRRYLASTFNWGL